MDNTDLITKIIPHIFYVILMWAVVITRYDFLARRNEPQAPDSISFINEGIVDL